MLGPLIWSLVNAAATVLIPFVLFIVFARTGEAWQVGAVGIAVSILEILKTFCPLGLYEILLRRETTREEEGSALGLLLLSGALAMLIYMALIVSISRHLASVEAIMPILLSLAPKLLFDVASIQPQAALARQLTFRRLALRTVIANIAAASVGTALAVLGYALAGLLFYYLLQSALGLALVISGQATHIRPRFSLSPLRKLFREAGYSSGVRVVAAANNYADTLVVSAFVSTPLVGFYNLAKRVETVLISTSSSMSTIMYQPLFASRGKDNSAGIIEHAVRITTLLFGIPVVIFFVFQRECIDLIFGARWLDAAPICALLALSGLARIYGGIHGSLLSVSSRNGVLFVYAASSAVIGLGSVALFASHGLVWVAAAIALKSWLFCFVSSFLTRHETGPVAPLYLKHVLLPLLWIALVTTGAAYAVASWSPTGAAGLSPSVVSVLAGSLAASTSILVIYGHDLSRIVRVMRAKFAR